MVTPWRNPASFAAPAVAGSITVRVRHQRWAVSDDGFELPASDHQLVDDRGPVERAETAVVDSVYADRDQRVLVELHQLAGREWTAIGGGWFLRQASSQRVEGGVDLVRVTPGQALVDDVVQPLAGGRGFARVGVDVVQTE